MRRQALLPNVHTSYFPGGRPAPRAAPGGPPRADARPRRPIGRASTLSIPDTFLPWRLCAFIPLLRSHLAHSHPVCSHSHLIRARFFDASTAQPWHNPPDPPSGRVHPPSNIRMRQPPPSAPPLESPDFSFATPCLKSGEVLDCHVTMRTRAGQEQARRYRSRLVGWRLPRFYFFEVGEGKPVVRKRRKKTV